jgi:hypothetical protein
MKAGVKRLFAVLPAVRKRGNLAQEIGCEDARSFGAGDWLRQRAVNWRSRVAAPAARFRCYGEDFFVFRAARFVAVRSLASLSR